VGELVLLLLLLLLLLFSSLSLSVVFAFLLCALKAFQSLPLVPCSLFPVPSPHLRLVWFEQRLCSFQTEHPDRKDALLFFSAHLHDVELKKADNLFSSPDSHNYKSRRSDTDGETAGAGAGANGSGAGVGVGAGAGTGGTGTSIGIAGDMGMGSQPSGTPDRCVCVLLQLVLPLHPPPTPPLFGCSGVIRFPSLGPNPPPFASLCVAALLRTVPQERRLPVDQQGWGESVKNQRGTPETTTPMVTT
jgi:hypothetical protein